VAASGRLISGVLITPVVSVAGPWQMDSDGSGWIYVSVVSACLIFIILAFLLFVFRINRKLKAIVISARHSAMIQQNRSKVLALSKLR
jgi:hypothetical protein